MKALIKKIIVLIFTLFLLFIGLFASLYVSFHEEETYGMVSNDGTGHFDFTGYNFQDEFLYVGQQGPVEFFYNRWIVTDKDDNPPTGYISLPRYWTNMEYNGEILPKDGYASYRIYTKGLTPGISISSSFMRLPGRIFFNGELAYEIGNPTKEKQNATVPLEGHVIPYIVPESGEVEVVIEIGNCGIGGIRTFPGFTLTSNLPFPYLEFLDSISIYSCAFMFFILIFSLLFLSFPAKRKPYILIILVLFLVYLVCDDTPFYIQRFGFLYRDYLANLFLTAIALILTVFTSYYYLIKEKLINYNKYHLITIIILNIIFLISFFFTYYTIYAFISYSLCSISMMSILFLLYKSYCKSLDKITLLTLIAMTLICALINITMVSSTGLLVFDLNGFYTVTLQILIILFVIIYLFHYKKIKRELINKTDIDIEKGELTYKTLIQTVNINEIETGISTIKNQYQEGLDNGRNATLLFTSSLRNQIMSIENGIISFDDEAKNAIIKAKYLNLSENKNIELIFDIDDLNPIVPSGIITEILDDISLNYNEGYIFIRLEIDQTINIIISYDNNHLIESPIISSIKERLNIIGGEITINSFENTTIYNINYPKDVLDYE